MSKMLDKKVHSFSRPASKIAHSKRKIARTMTRLDKVILNSQMKPKIQQNANERKASWIDVKDEVLKGEL